MPLIPVPPVSKVLEGVSDRDELKDVMRRMIESINEHLRFAGGVLDGLPVVGGKGERDSGGDVLSG